MFPRRNIILSFKKLLHCQDLFITQMQKGINQNLKNVEFSCLNYVKISSSLHTSVQNFEKDLVPTQKELAPRLQHFESIKNKDKKTFLKIIDAYNEKDKNKRGHLEFIHAALKYMEDFGVHGDLETYKKLMDVFPKGKMIPKNLVQAEFFHFFRHQNCAVEMLDKMEFLAIYPDRELGEIIVNVFGKSSLVYKKYARMMYWMPKFKNLNPYLLPNPLPDDIRELARLALKKMSVDPRTKIVEYDAKELEDSFDKTWVMSAQSIVQQRLIEAHPEEKAIYVEGPFLIWLRRISMTYFILRADPKIYPEIEEDDDDVSNLSLYMFGEKKPTELVLRPQSVHEQEDGVILGMCCTGTSSKDSLLSWIRFLRTTNPKLDSIPVLFTLRTSPSSLVAVNIKKAEHEKGTEDQKVDKKENM